MSLVRSRFAVLVILIASVVAAPGALAHGNYVAFVPNAAQASCQTCHGATTATTNPFGNDFRAAGQNAAAWAAIFDGDSDVDGQTNGEELGDPCGVFTEGGTPARATNISHPANPASTSTTPSAPDDDADEVSDSCDNCPADANTDQADTDGDGTGDVCEGGAEGEGEGEGEGEEGEGEGEEGEGEGDPAEGEGEGEGEDGPCSSSSVSRTGPQSSALASLALLALVALRRRR